MFDFHTHRLDTPPGAGIVCLPQEVVLAWGGGGREREWRLSQRRASADKTAALAGAEAEALPFAEARALAGTEAGALYAAGIHPWWVAQEGFSLEEHLAGLRRLLLRPEVVEIGECGFDSVLTGCAGLKPAPLVRQEEVFVAQVELSEAYGRPMTIHCVRCFDRLLRLRKELRPTQRWTIHGFRGKPALARQLLATGFDLSFGPLRNEESYALTPPERRHDETDSLA